MLQTIQAKAAKKRENGEGGFTLIELMVVVLIIAILLAIAIPTFLGAQNKAKDRSAQSNLRNMLTNAKTIYADTTSYASVTVGPTGSMAAIEPNVLLVNDTTDGTVAAKTVSAKTAVNSIILATLSAAGDCFMIKDSTTSGTQYFKAAGGSPAVCKAVDTVAWTDKWS
jgi:type IV pilus assembly protein PilA